MKYNCLDFAILCAINEKVCNAEEIICKTSTDFLAPPSYELYNCSFSSLVAGNYVTYANDTLAFTEKSKALFKKKSLFESKSAMISRLEDMLLATEKEGHNAKAILSYDTYQRAFKRLDDEYNFDAIMKLDICDGYTNFLLSPPKDGSEYSDGEISKCDTISLPLEKNLHIAEYIFESAVSLASPSKAKKVCISDGTSSYVMTMAQDGGKIKVSVQKILFNAKRFIDKRDSQLDYAQCAESCISFYTTQNTLYMSAALILLECECRQG